MIRQPRRLVPAIIAIAISVAFAAATMMFGDTVAKSVSELASGDIKDAIVVVTPKGSDSFEGPVNSTPETALSKAMVGAIEKVPGVSGVRASTVQYFETTVKGRQDFVLLSSVPPLSSKTTVLEGRLPKTSGEVAVPTSLKETRGATVGSTMNIVSIGSETEEPQSIQLTVVGVIQLGSDAPDFGSYPVAFALDDDIFKWSGIQGYDGLYVNGTGDPAQIRDAIKALPQVKSAEPIVRTALDERNARNKQIEDVIAQMTRVLLAFAGIASLVGALVIANTFSILVAQRTRALALLRCVGATRSQVFRTVISEAVLIGVIGSVIGLALALGLGLLLVAGSQLLPDEYHLGGLAVKPLALLLPFALGMTITLLAGVLPARRATQVAPLAAMRPQLAPVTKQRAGIVGIALGAVLAIGGFAALGYGATKPNLQVGIAGGAVSILGVILLGPLVVPQVAKVVGWVPAKLFKVPGQLAVENSRRNPRRAAATTSALLIGVSLITMFLVGQSSANATVDRSLNRQTPTDIIITPKTEAVSAELTKKISGTEGIAAATTVGIVDVAIGSSSYAMFSFAPNAKDALNYPKALNGLSDDMVLVPKGFKLTENGPEVTNGQKLTLTGAKGTLTLTANVDPDHLSTMVVTAATGEKLGTGFSQVWAKKAAGADLAAVRENLAASINDATVSVSVPADAKEEFASIFNVIVGVVTGLLGISVLIAVVGIGNTLNLSVLERTQESGLLRAMGLMRRQLRAMFGIEAVTLSAVAVVMGLALGLVYGIGGVYALLKGQVTIVLDVPWVSFAIIGISALFLGWLASVLPSIRGAKVSPAAALTVE